MLLLGGGTFFVFIVAVFALLVFASHGKNDSSDNNFAFGDKIGVIDLEGVIIEPQTIAKQLKKFGEDDSIKAIVLHVNTPGGGVAASEEIYEAVKRVREKNKKRIVASVETVGATMTRSPTFQSTGVENGPASLTCNASRARRISSKLRPALLG